MVISVNDSFLDKTLKKVLSFIVVFFITLVFINRNDILISTDYINYVEMYHHISDRWKDLDWKRIEPLFLISIYISKYLSLTAYSFLAICTIIYFVNIFYVLNVKLKFNIVVFLLFMSTPFFYNFSTNTIRQGLAFSFLFYLFFIKNDNFKKEVIISIVTVLIHFSSLLPIFLYFLLKYARVNKKIVFIVFVFSPFLFLVNMGNVINSILSLIPSVGALSRTVEYATSLQGNLVSGRVFYIVSYFCGILLIFNYTRISENVYNYRITIKQFDILSLFFMINVMLYPFLYGIGYLTRILNYGFVLSPLYFYLLFMCYTKQNILISCLFSIIYMIVYYIYISGNFIYGV